LAIQAVGSKAIQNYGGGMRIKDLTILEIVVSIVALVVLPVVLYLNRENRWQRIADTLETIGYFFRVVFFLLAFPAVFIYDYTFGTHTWVVKKPKNGRWISREGDQIN
jgi:hypothetical protein